MKFTILLCSFYKKDIAYFKKHIPNNSNIEIITISNLSDINNISNTLNINMFIVYLNKDHKYLNIEDTIRSESNFETVPILFFTTKSSNTLYNIDNCSKCDICKHENDYIQEFKLTILYYLNNHIKIIHSNSHIYRFSMLYENKKISIHESDILAIKPYKKNFLIFTRANTYNVKISSNKIKEILSNNYFIRKDKYWIINHLNLAEVKDKDKQLEISFLNSDFLVRINTVHKKYYKEILSKNKIINL